MIDKEEILTIIPHRGKMLLINRVMDYNINNGTITVESDIMKDCLFYDPVLDGVPSWVGFEYIAQAIGAFSGIRDRELGIKPKIGFLLNLPSIKINIPVFKLGSTVSISAKAIDLIEGIHTFDGEVNADGEIAMSGKIMVMELNDNDERFKEFIDSFKKEN